MNPLTMLTSAMQVGKQSFEMTLAMGDENYLPKLMAEIDGKFHVILYDGFMDSLVEALDVALEKGQVTMFTLTSDTYGIKESAWGDPKYTPGSLKEFFEAGDPNVGEALVVEVVTLDEAVQATIPYVRKGGSIQWRKHYVRHGLMHESMAMLRAALAMSAEQSMYPHN